MINWMPHEDVFSDVKNIVQTNVLKVFYILIQYSENVKLVVTQKDQLLFEA